MGAGTRLGRIFVEFIADVNPLKRSAAEAKSELDDVAEHAEQSAKKTSGAFAAIGGRINGATAGVRTLTGAITGAAGVVTGLLGVIGLVTAAVSGLVVLWKKVSDAQDAAGASARKYEAGLRRLPSILQDAVDRVNEVKLPDELLVQLAEIEQRRRNAVSDIDTVSFDERARQIAEINRRADEERAQASAEIDRRLAQEKASEARAERKRANQEAEAEADALFARQTQVRRAEAALIVDEEQRRREQMEVDLGVLRRQMRQAESETERRQLEALLARRREAFDRELLRLDEMVSQRSVNDPLVREVRKLVDIIRNQVTPTLYGLDQQLRAIKGNTSG